MSDSFVTLVEDIADTSFTCLEHPDVTKTSFTSELQLQLQHTPTGGLAADRQTPVSIGLSWFS